MSKRDVSLDFLKGIACLLMVLSHAAIDTKNPLLLGFGFLGSFAAVLFFSVTGITAWMQAENRSFSEIFPPYMFLFFAGFSLNGIIQVDFYQDFELEMLQMIAIGATLVFLARYYLHFRPIHFLIGGLLIFPIHLHFESLFNHVSSTLFFNPAWVQGWFVPPGTFTVIPWLFAFFIGVFAYYSSARINLAFASISIFTIVMILLITRNPAKLDLVNKWNMSVGYYLFSCFWLFFCYYLTKRFQFSFVNTASRFIIFLGKNSLLFLYIHIFVINILYRLGLAKLTWFYWILILTFTCLIQYLILLLYPKLNISWVFHYKIAWFLLVVSVMLTPLFFRSNLMIFLIEFLLGILLSTNYTSLKEIFRRKKTILFDSEKTAGAQSI